MCTVTMTGELKTTLNKTFKQLNPKPVKIYLTVIHTVGWAPLLCCEATAVLLICIKTELKMVKAAD